MKKFGVLIRIFNNELGLEVHRKEYVVLQKKLNLRDIMADVESRFAEDNDMDLDTLPYCFGVRGFLVGETIDSYPESDQYLYFQPTNFNQQTISTTDGILKEWRKEEQKTFLWQSMPCYAKINIYQKGYGFSIGKTSNSLYGAKLPLFLVKITSSRFKYGDAMDALTFDSHTKALKYLESHIWEFNYMKEQYGYTIDYVANNNFELAAIANEKPLTAKQNEALGTIISTLTSINGAEEKGYQYPSDVSLEGQATKEEMKEEALRRLKALGQTELITQALKHNKLYRSEFDGILYDVNDKELQNILDIELKGNLVYHVIKGTYRMSDDSFMECSDFLTVSQNKDEWQFERPDGINNYVTSYCSSNLNYRDFEIGDIKVEAVNGGLKRVEG